MDDQVKPGNEWKIMMTYYQFKKGLKSMRPMTASMLFCTVFSGALGNCGAGRFGGGERLSEKNGGDDKQKCFHSLIPPFIAWGLACMGTRTLFCARAIPAIRICEVRSPSGDAPPPVGPRERCTGAALDAVMKISALPSQTHGSVRRNP